MVNSKTSRTPWEIQAWSAYMETRGPDSDAESLASFAEQVGQDSKTREDIKSWFDALTLIYVSFGGKAREREINIKPITKGSIP